MERKTVIMIGAGLVLAYFMLRANSANAAEVDSESAWGTASLGGGGGGGGSGAAGGGGSSIFQQLQDVVNDIFEAPVQAVQNLIPPPPAQGTITPGPLPVAIDTVQDAPRVEAAVTYSGPPRNSIEQLAKDSGVSYETMYQEIRESMTD